jgi:hypothetical protein
MWLLYFFSEWHCVFCLLGWPRLSIFRGSIKGAKGGFTSEKGEG